MIINLFISHSWSHSGHYDTLNGWIFGKKWTSPQGESMQFQNNSVPKEDPIHNAPNQEILRQQIWARISQSHIVIIPTGMYANYSKWIKKEIEGANQHERPILAVDPWGQERKSSTVLKYANEQVGWTTQSVANGIWKIYTKYYHL